MSSNPPGNSTMLDSLAPQLKERTRLICPNGDAHQPALDVEDRPGGHRWIVYWVRTAMRGHDNPALDVALTLANDRGLPVVVYQELNGDGPRPYGSDRHHFFVLEGARDLQWELESRGIGYALHVQRRGDRASHLEALIDEAAAVVVEDLPVYWHRRQSEQLATSTHCPVLAVDTACVVPVDMVPGDHDRAYRFRKAHRPLLKERLHRRWQPIDPEVEPITDEALPFDPVDPRGQDLAHLVSQCPIDHSIGPVADTPGGCAAAYARWRAFRDTQLSRYHANRNDAALPRHVSRLSAYLHYGQISPFRVARQTAEIGGDGADKFIDELITWREFAHHIGRCYRAKPGWDWLPDWAQQTLVDHRRDRRHAHYGWEPLARGKTADELWNLAQQSLLAHGELHNNLRMTWGKQFLNWTDDPRRAVELAIDLNDRYALDGADPNSYLGILWCFGGFDRPFSPARPIFGQIRSRSTTRHRQRLDVDAYRAWVNRPPTTPIPRIAVIGAGIAGLTCARLLSDQGLRVEVFDKGRGPGGRSSTRRSREGYQFDHGAQYFTARSEVLRRYLESWVDQGVAAEWTPTIAVVDADGIHLDRPNKTQRFVGVPGNNAICAHLAKDLQPQYGKPLVGLIDQPDDRWRLQLEGDDPVGPFDRVVLTAPAPQTADLLASIAPTLAARANAVDFQASWALMVAFEQPLPLARDALFINDGPLRWMARDSSKPGRPGGDKGHHTWVVQASAQWSEKHLERAPEEVAAMLVDAMAHVAERFGVALPQRQFTRAHRWRYAQANPPQQEGYLCCRETPGLVLSGDWIGGSRIEGAFLSGVAAAGRIISEIADDIRGDASSRPLHRR